ncbi:MAG: hypothetical protein ABI833_10130 [Acidobacteriota bacterium]
MTVEVNDADLALRIGSGPEREVEAELFRRMGSVRSALWITRLEKRVRPGGHGEALEVLHAGRLPESESG